MTLLRLLNRFVLFDPFALCDPLRLCRLCLRWNLCFLLIPYFLYYRYHLSYLLRQLTPSNQYIRLRPLRQLDLWCPLNR